MPGVQGGGDVGRREGVWRGCERDGAFWGHDIRYSK